LGELLPQVVFIGGTVLELYFTDPAMPETRSSEDVDCLIAASGLGFWLDWEQRLLAKGFEKLNPGRVPATQWRYQGIRVNLISATPEMMGFENRWFEEGLFHARTHALAGGPRVRIFDPVYFLATKLEALGHRGWQDLRDSKDLEDVLYLIEGRAELFEEIEAAFHEVRSYLRGRLKGLLKHPQLEEAIYCLLPLTNSAAQVSRVLLRLREMAQGQPVGRSWASLGAKASPSVGPGLRWERPEPFFRKIPTHTQGPGFG